MTGVQLDPFYLIVGNADWAERLVPLGVKLVQLRIKDRTDADIASQIKAATKVCAAHDCQLIINDYWWLALELGCNFVHLGQEDLDGADLAAIRAAGIRLGVSTHDPAELVRALALKPDYVALGPVFETVLKKMKWAPQGLERVAQWKKQAMDVPLVAIGGLTPDRAQDVLGQGADSAAVVTDILRHPDPEGRTREWLAATRRFKP